MYQTKIASASGRYAVDTSGASLYNIGNVSLKTGDYVMTDGRFIYGRHRNHGLADIPYMGQYYIFMAGNKLQLIPLNNLYSPYEIAIDESVEYGPESTIIMGEKTAWLMIKDERKYTFTNLLTNESNNMDFTCDDYYPVVSVRSIKDTLYVLAHESYDSLSLYVDSKKKWDKSFTEENQSCSLAVYAQIMGDGTVVSLWRHDIYSDSTESTQMINKIDLEKGEKYYKSDGEKFTEISIADGAGIFSHFCHADIRKESKDKVNHIIRNINLSGNISQYIICDETDTGLNETWVPIVKRDDDDFSLGKNDGVNIKEISSPDEKMFGKGMINVYKYSYVDDKTNKYYEYYACGKLIDSTIKSNQYNYQISANEHHEYSCSSTDIVLSNDISLTYYGVNGSDDSSSGGSPDLRGKICGYDFALWGKSSSGSVPDAYKMSDGNILLLTDKGLMISDGENIKNVTSSSFMSTYYGGLYNSQINFIELSIAEKALNNCAEILANIKHNT